MTFMSAVKSWEPDLCLYFCFWSETDVYLIFLQGRIDLFLNLWGKKSGIINISEVKVIVKYKCTYSF